MTELPQENQSVADGRGAASDAETAGHEPAPAERVAADMLTIASLVEGDFVTARQRAAFMVSSEIHLNEAGRLIFGRDVDPESYRDHHVIRYTELKGGDEVQADIRIHKPGSQGDVEYSLALYGDAQPIVQRGVNQNEEVAPDQEDDAVYVGWVLSSLRGEIGTLHAQFGIGVEDPSLPINQYDQGQLISGLADPSQAAGGGWINQ